MLLGIQFNTKPKVLTKETPCSKQESGLVNRVGPIAMWSSLQLAQLKQRLAVQRCGHPLRKRLYRDGCHDETRGPSKETGSDSCCRCHWLGGRFTTPGAPTTPKPQTALLTPGFKVPQAPLPLDESRGRRNTEGGGKGNP